MLQSQVAEVSPRPKAEVSPRSQIILSGSLTYDYLMSIPESFSEHILPDHLDKLNLSMVANSLVKSRGGTAGNIGYTMKLLDTPPIIVSALGSDGSEYLNYLETEKVKIVYVNVDSDSLSPSVYIVSDKNNNQITTYYGGIDAKLTPGISEVKETVAYAIISPSGNMLRHMRECAELGIKAIFDPGQISNMFTPAEFREMLTSAEIFIGNEYEAHIMLEKTGWTLDQIRKKVPLVIITKGEHGSELFPRDGASITLPACQAERVLDPTGAGDSYRAGLLAGLARGFDLLTSARMGSVAGAYCVEEHGGQNHTFTIPEFCARYKKTYEKDLTI